MSAFDLFRSSSVSSIESRRINTDSILVLQLLFSDKYLETTQRLVAPPTESELSIWQATFLKTYKILGQTQVGLRAHFTSSVHDDSALVITVSQSVLASLLFSRDFSMIRRIGFVGLTGQQLDYFRKTFYFYFGSKNGTLSDFGATEKQKIFEFFISFIVHPDVAMYEALLYESKTRSGGLKKNPGAHQVIDSNSSAQIGTKTPQVVDKILGEKQARLYR